MRTRLAATAVSVTVCATAAAQAGGIDRYGQNVDILFKDGNYAEVSYNSTTPSVTGYDLPQSPPGFPVTLDTGAKYSNVAHDFGTVGFGFKYDVNDSLALALIGGEDYGADILYGGDPAFPSRRVENAADGVEFAEVKCENLHYWCPCVWRMV